MFEPEVMITKYSVGTYPDPDSINASLYQVEVEFRGKGRWAVCRMGRCYDKDAVAEYEPRPSEREDGWLDRFRFTSVAEALEVAKTVAQRIVVNGQTVEQVWEWEQAHSKDVSA